MYDIFVICYLRVVLHVHSKAIVRYVVVVVGGGGGGVVVGGVVVVVVVVVVSFLHLFQCYSLI